MSTTSKVSNGGLDVLVAAAGSGCAAALDAERYLAGLSDNRANVDMAQVNA
ncbi:hypothetical protein ABT143_04445 [Streptomyces sp. NPDC002033]|uniref:hypothetical protein n=1 Tax=unclassified Streptomyces TaxID=2593676 RepID=UPI0033345D2F